VKHKTLYIAFSVFILISLSILAFSQFTRVEIRPRSYNFGKVNIGESKSKSISLRNSDNAFRVIEFSFLHNSSPDFIVTSMPEGRPIPPGRPEYFEVMYRPTSTGVVQATLRITVEVDERSPSIVSLKLKGYGGSSEIEKNISDIIAFIKSSTDEGKLVGVGEGGSANKRLNDLKKIIKDAVKALEKGKTEDACKKFLDAVKKMDGESSGGNPKDLVTGEATQELAEVILILREQLGCKQ
jgi:hypothetical protein